MNHHLANAYYVYGFTRAGVAPEAGFGVGIDDRHVPFIWTHGEISAVLSLVAPEDFCGPAGEGNLQNLDWLGPRACRHQTALEQVMRGGPVLPTRFGTLFSSLEQMEKFLSTNAPAIVRFLDRTAGQDEWAVKGLLCRANAEEKTLARLLRAGEPADLSPGRAYLREQSLQIKAKQELEIWLAKVCGELIQKLELVASAACQRRILTQAATETASDMILNWAFLLPRPALADFGALIEHANSEHNTDGLAFKLSGPWPPYSFLPTLEPESILETK